MKNVESLTDAKKRLADKKYRELVMQKYNDFEHHDKREHLERRAAVEAAAKEQL